MNQVTYLGRLIRKPEVRTTTSQKVMTTFTLAVNREFKNQEGKYDADFFPCVVWGKLGEVAGNYLDKGHRVLVTGRNQNRTYEGKDGIKRTVTELIVGSIDFIEKKESKMQSLGEEVPFN